MAVADDLDHATDSQWDWVAEQTRTYLASGGTEGHESNGVYTLVLATTGRRTGIPRRTCLIYGTAGEDFVVVASKGGADEDPAWFKNLQADPSVGVQVGGRRFTARARVASPAEREPLWSQMARIFPLYDEYAQESLVATEGVTVLIHDQRCAAENRRDRKRGRIATPSRRIVINERVCEGCGDCGVKSNCLSVEPVETEFGRKTRINQDSCNLDFSCLQGHCPSFMTVTLPKRSTTRRQRRDDDLSAVLSQPIPEPELPSAADGFVIRMPGIGGTGVVTTSQIIGTAALLDGRHTVGLDQTGLSQKAGPVVSDLTICDSPRIASNKAAAGTVDLLLGLDVLGSGTEMTLASTEPGRSVAVVSTTRTPTGRMVSDVSASWPETASFERGLEERLGRGRVHWVDAEQVVRDLFGSASVLNLFMVGAAFQLAALPVSAASLERAIALNGVAVQANIDAFLAGRLWVCDRAVLAPRLSDETPLADSANAVAAIPIPELDHDPRVRELAEARSAELVRYQSRHYARRFVDVVTHVTDAETQALAGSTAFTEATVHGLFKLMAFKDEYEVARLSLDPQVKRDIEERFGPDATVRWQLHPPILRAMGMSRKLSLGPWFTPALWLLHRLRRLRGTRFDLFGYTALRRLERRLVDEYVELVLDLSNRVDAASLGVAVEIAALPAMVRGYESIKERNVESYRTAVAGALRRFDELASPDRG
ncbi:hypothetical protein GCM10023080_002300 [Streptomyces pseudoechinosporeus]